MAELKLTDDQLQDIISGAIIEAIGPEERNRLIKAAIIEMFERSKEPGAFGGRRTTVQTMFEIAVERYATEVIHEMLKDDEELRAKIKGIIHKAVDDAAADETFARTIASAISSSLEIRP